MIPQFPEFKKLELSDRADVEKLTSKYDPYSDFNFVVMWSWNLRNSMEISQLNGNLVIQPNDYFSDNYSLSYLGNNEIGDTLEKLFAYMILEGVEEPILKFVPEISLSGIDLDKYLIEIDIDNCDYIYNVESTAGFIGSAYGDKRRKLNTFFRNHNQYEVLELDFHNQSVKDQVVKLNDLWSASKGGSNEDLFSYKENVAIQRFFEANFSDVLWVGVKISGELKAYSVTTLLSGEYAISHFAKGDLQHNGIYEYLMKGTSEILFQRGKKLLNYQEDMGIPGLRFFKNSLKPTSFLRKYYIRQR